MATSITVDQPVCGYRKAPVGFAAGAAGGTPPDKQGIRDSADKGFKEFDKSAFGFHMFLMVG